MGIKGLLPALASVQEAAHVSEYSGKRIAIDGFAWFHRGAIGSALALVAGKQTYKPIQYVLNRVRLLLRHGIIPVFVFDGMNLPSKHKTNSERRIARAEAKELCLKMLKENKSKEAFKYASQAIEINEEMVLNLIKELDKSEILHITAPYEADSQLGYLCSTGFVDAVLSEDSDLLLYGCHCVLYKLQDATGDCMRVYSSRIKEVGLLPPSLYSEDNMIVLCSLAGCDYIESINGIGLKKAAKYVKQVPLPSTTTAEMSSMSPTVAILKPLERLRLLLSDMRKSGFTIPNEYEYEVLRSLWTFKHQTSYNPLERTLGRRYPLPYPLDEIWYLRDDSQESTDCCDRLFSEWVHSDPFIDEYNKNQLLTTLKSKIFYILDSLGTNVSSVEVVQKFCEGTITTQELLKHHDVRPSGRPPPPAPGVITTTTTTLIEEKSRRSHVELLSRNVEMSTTASGAEDIGTLRLRRKTTTTTSSSIPAPAVCVRESIPSPIPSAVATRRKSFERRSSTDNNLTTTAAAAVTRKRRVAPLLFPEEDSGSDEDKASSAVAIDHPPKSSIEAVPWMSSPKKKKRSVVNSSSIKLRDQSSVDALLDQYKLVR